MGVLIVDTETTGLPLYGADNPADAPWQPRMCSIAMALVTDVKGGVSLDGLYHCLIRPEGWPLDDERFVANMDQAREKAHGLTLEDLEKNGVPIAEAHAKWQEFYSKAKYICGYNIWFDHKVIRGEWKRLGHPIPFREKQGICLMKAARPACGLGKNPKLGEAVRLLLGREHSGAHTAAGDVEASIDLYLLFKGLDVLEPEDQPEAKVKP